MRTGKAGSDTLSFAAPDLDPEAIFESGQCFRWAKKADGSWEGVALGRRVRVLKKGDELVLFGVPVSETEKWRAYFDLGRDYDVIRAACAKDAHLARAVSFAPGLRVLRQDPWEALCSFILSQDNNIPRIKGIVERLCAALGQPLVGGGFSFPSAETLAPLSEEDLAPVRCGFRARYVLDAARKAAGGEVNLEELAFLPLGEARASLRTICGVGPKVADCALLFGCGRVDCFPVDVWMRRVLRTHYPHGFPAFLKPVGGIAQQFLFYYERCRAVRPKASLPEKTGTCPARSARRKKSA